MEMVIGEANIVCVAGGLVRLGRVGVMRMGNGLLVMGVGCRGCNFDGETGLGAGCMAQGKLAEFASS